MRHTVWILSFATFLLAQNSLSLPRFALMTGNKCQACHVNPTGGQMRTDYGIKLSTDVLPLEATRDEEFTFSGKLNENISLGGDYRSQFIWDQFSQTTTFQSMTTSIYGTVRLARRISFYFKQDLINGTYNGLYGGAYNGTEVYGLARILPRDWYIKGGAFLPDYGWRLDDHTAYTRGGDLGFTGAGFHQSLFFIPNYHDIGAEIGGSIADLWLTAGIFNGSGHLGPIDFFKDKAYAAKIEYLGSLAAMNFRLGVSGYGYSTYHMGGVHAGVASPDSCLIVFGEMDWTHHKLSLGSAGRPLIDPRTNTMAAFAEADYRLIRGLWATGRYDAYDPAQGVGDDETKPDANLVQRITLGLEFFPYSFVEVRPQLRLTLEKPGVSDNNVAFVQMHLWF